MYLGDYADFAYLVKTGEVPQAGALITKINSQDGTFPARLDLVNAANGTTVVSCAEANVPALRQLEPVRGHVVYRNDEAWPRAVWRCDLAELSRTDIVTRLVHSRYTAAGDLVTAYPVAVRWAAAVSDTTRSQLETRYALGSGESLEGTVRRYVVSNPDADMLLKLAGEPAAEDTNGFDRSTGLVPAFEPVSGIQRGADHEWLTGTRPCAARSTVHVVEQDRPDGKVAADVDSPVAGYTYFSEPYYSERRAYIDGVAAPVRKTNLAFSAVPVPAGHHRVELRYVPDSFYAGTGVSGLTLVGWLAASWRARRRTNADRA
jgi:hypothetical protein